MAKVKNKLKKHMVPISEGKRGQDIAKVNNPLIIPLAIIEALFAGVVCYLNYILRYDEQIREDCSMVNWKGVQLPCEDIADIKRPVYNETDDSTTEVTFSLPEWTFFTCAIVVPCGLVIVLEVIRLFFPAKNAKVVMIGNFQLVPTARRIPRFISTFMMGGAVAGTFVAILKLLLASPRPHFIEVCSPNTTMDEDCSAKNLWTPYTACEGDALEVHEALRAFPSYHACIAVYCGIWTTVYLSTTPNLSGVYNPCLVMVGAVLIMASIGTTHHLSIGLSSGCDVIVGGIIGAIVALYVTLVILKGFKEKRFKVKEVKSINHPNLMPIVHLGGSAQETSNAVLYPQDLLLSNEDDDTDDDADFFQEPQQLPIISMIPRAISIHPSKSDRPIYPSAQAVNSNVQKSTGTIPKPPPMPSYGPPPTYSRMDMQSYNMPRQRYSAPPGRSPRAPDYNDSGNNVLQAYYSEESDVSPRARTETDSYF